MTDTLLLVTATKVETTAVLDTFQEVIGSPHTRSVIGKKTYYSLGTVGAWQVHMVQSEMGTSTLGGALLTIHDAIAAVSPTAIVMVGLAFGVDNGKQEIGDILVSHQLQAYEPQRVGTGQAGEVELLPRGDRVTASPRLLDKFRAADMTWRGPMVHFGLIVSGEKLIDNERFRNTLLDQAPEAVGGDMEGVGLYVAAYNSGVDWLIVKGICDWADGNKHRSKAERQRDASRNAARFVLHTFYDSDVSAKHRVINVHNSFRVLFVLLFLTWVSTLLPLGQTLVSLLSSAFVAVSCLFLLASGNVKLTSVNHYVAARLAEQRQAVAYNKLRHCLKERLYHKDARLLRAYSVRSLALAIEKKTKSPVINEFLIAEVVRSIALEIEEREPTDVVVPLLSKLNALLKDLQGFTRDRPPLLCLAQTDPLGAYKDSPPARHVFSLVALGVFYIVAAVGTHAFRVWYPRLALVTPWAVLLMFSYGVFLARRGILSGIRARNYWYSCCTDKQGGKNTPLSPNQLDPKLDFYAFIAVSHDPRFLRRYSMCSPLTEVAYSRDRRFVEMHEYRYSEALPYLRRFDKLYPELLRRQRSNEKICPEDMGEYSFLCRRLWVISGLQKYRLLMNKAADGIVYEVDTHRMQTLPPKLVSRQFNRLHRQVQGDLAINRQTVPMEQLREYESLCRHMWETTGRPVYRDLLDKVSSLIKQSFGASQNGH